MTIKSLTITEDAYTALKTVKHGDESFSEVILRLSREKIGLTAKYFGALSGKTESLRKNVHRQRLAIEDEFKTRVAKMRRTKQ